MATRGQSQIHVDLMQAICDEITTPDFARLKDQCKAKSYGGFGAGQLEKIVTLPDLFAKLQQRRIFKEGDYTNLKLLLGNDNEAVLDLILEAERQLYNDKQTVFIECLRKKIKSWYETMTPIPWKKSCKWTTSELFINTCGLTLTDPRSKSKTSNIDPECKLQYSDIFTHNKLKSETLIIIEGDPGSGKTMLSSQLAYDWSIKKNSSAKMVIFLPLKFVEDMTILEAIHRFYITKDKPLDEDDIEAVLNQASDDDKIYIILDGLEEYNGMTKDGEPSEVEKVMRKKKFPNCTVILTSRSDCIHDIPQCPMLKLGSFGEEERDMYIDKIIPDDKEKQQKVKTTIQNSAFLLDVCSNPLLFVLVVHNMEMLVQLEDKMYLHRIGPFMQAMVDNMLSHTKSEHADDTLSDILSAKFISELAFNGLCKGYQQLMWGKKYLDKNISNMKDWVESGILVVEEGLVIGGKDEQNKRETEVKDEGGMVVAEGDEQVRDRDVSSMKVIKREKNEMVDIKKPLKLNKHGVGLGMLGEHSTQHDTPSTSKSTTSRMSSQSAHPSMKATIVFDPRNVFLQVKFLHKIIQEWFAAKHFSSMLIHSTSKKVILKKYLPMINPADLYYVLRFTSYLCPDSCHLIMKHLHSGYAPIEGTVPEYILNCIFLCFAECDSSKQDHNMDNAVRPICNNVVTIRGEDSRLLQQSKVSMLMYTSNSKIQIRLLRLVNLVDMVAEPLLTFNNNVSLECLPTLEMIEVSQWEQKLEEEEYKDLIKFISKCKSVKEAHFYFPSPPPVIDKMTLSCMKNLTVEWIIGEQLVHTLDSETGEWMIEIRRPRSFQFGSTNHSDERGHSGGESRKFQHDSGRPMRDDFLPYQSMMTLMVNKDGGVLEIPNTGVSLEIPPGALESERMIEMSIVPHYYQNESTFSFSNGSLVVKFLPSKLKLLKEAKFTLPHCLVLKKGSKWNAKIYSSHHEEGSQPEWEEQVNTRYELCDTNCVIWLQTFSWEKIEVNDGIVEGKRIILYGAKSLQSTNTIAHIDIGYYLDLPGSQEAVMMNVAMLQHKRTVFYREARPSLKILFKKTKPALWTCIEDKNVKEISFQTVAVNKWNCTTFAFQKKKPNKTNAATMPEGCSCYFNAGQESEFVELVCPLEEKAASSTASSSTKSMEGVASRPQRPAIEDLVVDDNTLKYLSERNSNKWWIVRTNLGLDIPELDNFMTDACEGHEEAVYQMLLKWKRRNGKKATHRKLGEALHKAGEGDLQAKMYKQARLSVPWRDPDIAKKRRKTGVDGKPKKKRKRILKDKH